MWCSNALLPGTYMLREYHSFPNAGTEYTPQWRKMPNFASRNQSGARYWASESQVAWKGALRLVGAVSARTFATWRSVLAMEFCGGGDCAPRSGARTTRRAASAKGFTATR